MRQKLQGRKGCFFSKGVKEILIKSIIQTLPTYYLSVLKLPKTLVTDFNSTAANFWWGSSEKDSKLH